MQQLIVVLTSVWTILTLWVLINCTKLWTSIMPSVLAFSSCVSIAIYVPVLPTPALEQMKQYRVQCSTPNKPWKHGCGAMNRLANSWMGVLLTQADVMLSWNRLTKKEPKRSTMRSNSVLPNPPMGDNSCGLVERAPAQNWPELTKNLKIVIYCGRMPGICKGW